MDLLESSITRTGTNPLDNVYDHPIRLLDTSKPISTSDTEDDEQPNPEPAQLSRNESRLSRTLNKKAVKESIARRKYRKWQRQHSSHFQEESEISLEEPTITSAENPRQFMVRSETGQTNRSSIRRWSHSSKANLLATETAARSKEAKEEHKLDAEVDVLYENQRGWFFFGIPLYSASSLLNFDPPSWLSADFKPSAVNITNAQVPDPSWEWVWKQWYVDMSYDVDDEGWQYSFSFASRFSWHGTHPWFHSFARRRRWLRKRSKRKTHSQVNNAHMLTSDYFTIHPGAGESGASSPRAVARDETGLADQGDVPIDHIANLMVSLKQAAVDREKIDAVREFIAAGGDDVACLQAMMPEIVSMFVFQNSRRHLLQFLSKSLEDAMKELDDPDARNSDRGAIQRRSEYLQQAIEATEEQIKSLDFWSDVKRATNGGSRPTTKSSEMSKQIPVEQVDFSETIKGIPEGADIGVDLPKIARYTEFGTDQPKGKGKANEA